MLDGFRCNLCVAKKNVKATTIKDENQTEP
ncbi:hypothetical protein BDA96_01G134500 [Sorghum bicolor]|uniref:Uncharacterized protein n=1 Tax=Sorghum bicolor TaxID=4558 RepID=A0A921V003_SORBI|nr:hypothetical protein BDA96_01G134500 [Sorghum bicolor]